MTNWRDEALALHATPPRGILFLCVANSARSQMAEALLRGYGGAAFEAFSAGTEVTSVHPMAVAVLAEQEIDWSAARSKSITEFLDQRFDYVITVCDRARETCPVFPTPRTPCTGASTTRPTSRGPMLSGSRPSDAPRSRSRHACGRSSNWQSGPPAALTGS